MCCCCRTKKKQRQIHIYNRSNTKLEKELDLLKMVKSRMFLESAVKGLMSTGQIKFV